MSSTPKSATFGSWESPISASFITSQSIKLCSLDMSEDKTSQLFWTEARPEEKGRQCQVKLDCVTKEKSDVTPPELNARSRVHEYGGGQSIPIGNNGDTITSDFTTNKLVYTRHEAGLASSEFSITSEQNTAYRYADMCLDSLESNARNNSSRLMFAVREDHSVDEPAHVVNSIVVLSLDRASEDGHVEVILVNAGSDPSTMYSSPRVDPSGTFLCWIQWKHPNMPWDATELCVGQLTADGKGLTNITVIAGGEDENVSQPRWCGTAGRYTLLYLSDKSLGWWNFYKAELQAPEINALQSGSAPLALTVSPVLLCEGYEFGPPAWSFGAKSYDILPSSGQLMCTWLHETANVTGRVTQSVRCLVICSIDSENTLQCDQSIGDNCTETMTVLPIPDAHPEDHPAPYALSAVLFIVAAASAAASSASGSDYGVQDIYLIGGSPASPAGVYKLQIKLSDSVSSQYVNHSALVLLKSSMGVMPDPGCVSHPQHIQFPTKLLSAVEEDECAEVSNAPSMSVAHGLYYPPKNEKFTGVAGELPPLLVKIHGGPTGQTSTICRLDIQYFTSRGIAVLDVDYGGSTGYGRAYRNRLKGTWGLTDVEDCCRGAEYLAALGVVDVNKLCIDGGSAGGFTTLACIAFRDTFKAATSSYGIGDLEALACDTHKFESRYLDTLVGPYPEAKQVYEERSALRHCSNISCPILLLQGVDDKVVLPNQATMMYEAVVAKSIPAALVLFEGEGHGWRQADTIQRALNIELNFYGLIFGFTPDVIVDVPIVNLSR